MLVNGTSVMESGRGWSDISQVQLTSACLETGNPSWICAELMEQGHLTFPSATGVQHPST